MDNNDKNKPAPPKEADVKNITNPQDMPSFTTSAEIRLDQSMKMFLQGKRAYDKAKYDESIDSFKSAIEALKPSDLSNQESSVFYSYLGLAMLKKGWTAYANAQFKLALNLNPNDTIALENMPGANKANLVTKKNLESTNDRSFIKKIKSIFSK